MPESCLFLTFLVRHAAWCCVLVVAGWFGGIGLLECCVVAVVLILFLCLILCLAFRHCVAVSSSSPLMRMMVPLDSFNARATVRVRLGLATVRPAVLGWG